MLHSIFQNENLMKVNLKFGNENYPQELLDETMKTYQHISEISSNVIQKINQDNEKIINEILMDSYTEQINFLFEKVIEGQNLIHVDAQENDNNFQINKNEKFRKIIDKFLLRYKFSQTNLFLKCVMLKPRYLVNFYDYINGLELDVDGYESSWEKNNVDVCNNNYNFQIDEIQEENLLEIQDVFLKTTISTKKVLNKIVMLLEFEYLKKSTVADIQERAENIGYSILKLYIEKYYSQKQHEAINNEDNKKFEQLLKVWFVNLWK